MNKSLSYVNFVFGVACFFNILIGIWHIRYFFLTFFAAIIWTWETNLEDWKMFIRWCRTDIFSCKLSAKKSLMLDNPFLDPSFCKLNHNSVFFIQTSTKSPANSLFPLGKAIFFWSYPRCFGPLGKFQHNIKISIFRRPVFPDYLFVSCDCASNNPLT